MANTFYKPKNEYGELLISEKDAITIINSTAGDINNRIDSEVDELNGIISDTEKSLTEKINEADLLLNEKINDTNDQLNEKIDTVEKQVTEHIIEVDEKHSLIIEEVLASEGVDPHEHFRLTIESDWETAINEGTLKEFAWRLAKTVFLVKNAPIKCECATTCSCDDTYEEFICINPTKITEGEKPRFTRLGAVDSILATSKLPGSSMLVSDIYHTTDWDNFANNDKPVAGLSVAPIALRDFVHADTSISARLDARSEEIQKDIDAINDNLSHIRTELDGTIAEDGISGSRIDIIERVIGINGCCDNKEECSNKNHNTTCEYCEPDCNIFCKINDINIRLDDNDRNDQELGAALEETNNNLSATDERITAEVEAINNRINDLSEKHDIEVENLSDSLDAAHSRIGSLNIEHEALVSKNLAEHNEIIGIIGANKAEATAKFYELDKIDGRHSSELGRLEDKIDREVSDRIALSGQYSDLNNRVNDLYSDNSAIRSDINAHEKVSSTKFDEIEDSLAKDSEKLKDFEAQNADEHEQFSTKIKKSETEISKIETLLNNHIEKTTDDIYTIKEDVTTNKNNIASIDSSLSEVSDDLDSLSERVLTVVEDLEKNIDLANENANDITSIESRLNIAESSIASNNVERIKDIQSLATSLTQEIATRANEDTNIKAIITQELSKQYDKISGEIQTGLSTKVDLATYDSDIITINERLNDLGAEDTDIRSEISNNKTETDNAIEVINKKVTAHQGNIDALIAKTDLHESDISSAKNNITLNATNISNLNSEVEKNRDDISDLQSTVTANSNRISVTEGTLTQLETKVDLLVIDNNTNKENISTINNDISEINNTLAEIKNLVDTSEGSINIFATATIRAGRISIPTEKILNRISAGEEKFWTITVNSVQEETSSGYQVIYPEIIYSSNTIEIIFGDENSADLNILIAFTGINTTTNDIITL